MAKSSAWKFNATSWLPIAQATTGGDCDGGAMMSGDYSETSVRKDIAPAPAGRGRTTNAALNRRRWEIIDLLRRTYLDYNCSSRHLFHVDIPYNNSIDENRLITRWIHWKNITALPGKVLCIELFQTWNVCWGFVEYLQEFVLVIGVHVRIGKVKAGV